jgi:uncharacterized protein YndB with AHSA1/START domain
VDGWILVENGVPRRPDHRRRRDRRGRAAAAVGDPLAAPEKPELKAEGESLCTMELEPSGTAVKLSITHTIEREPSKLIEAVSGGWPKIISNLKSLLETGSAVLQDPYPTGNQR